MLERLNQFSRRLRLEVNSARGAILIEEILKDKLRVMAEETFARRIVAAIYLEEIQLVSQFPLNPPKEPIDIRFSKLAGLEDQGCIIFLVVNPEWINKAWRSKDHDAEEKEYFYRKLKLALEAIDKLREQGDKVLNGTEIEEIRKKHKEQKTSPQTLID